MALPLNVGRDGVIFVNCLRPAGKLLYRLKHAPPQVKLPILAAAGVAALGGIAYYTYRKASET
ncbi:MAG: hypothetical protein QGG42_12225 [Phycisphaerae bacterium]|jgi:hypothetical protein|nr:hypothetical protein [Phycisphaerae bacterium]